MVRVMQYFMMLLCVALAASPVAASQKEEPLPIRLTPVYEPHATQEWIETVCSSLSIPCNPRTTSAFSTNSFEDTNIYLIDTSRPMLTAWETLSSKEGKPFQQWDFIDYRHASIRKDAHNELQIHPVFYPSKNGHVIALISHEYKSFDNGKASFNIADFILLEEAPKFSPVYPSVPFSCLKIIRACLTDEEIETSSHCYDENFAYLTVTPHSDGKWQFLWNETAWPAHTHRQSKTLVKFVLSPNATRNPKSLPQISFCGGTL